MRHPGRDKVEAATETTAERLANLSLMSGDYPSDAEFYRDIIHVLAIHVRKCGQEELGEQIEEFLIGHTTPIKTATADPGTPTQGA